MPKEFKPVLRRPGPGDRLMVVGATGSGKTVAGISHLAWQDFDQKPWVLFNTKGDSNLNSIKGSIEWNVHRPPPIKPGIYQVRPKAGIDAEAVRDFLYQILDQENVGLYIDEGYAIAHAKKINYPFQDVMTQGRSKNITCIINSQKPSWIDPFVTSEAGFYQVFRLNDERDKRRLREFIPEDAPVVIKPQSMKEVDTLSLGHRLPPFHSMWYDVGQHKGAFLKPARPAEESVFMIDRRLDAIRQTDNTVRRIKV